MERKKRTAASSRTEQTYIIMPQYLNGAGKLFGGQILSWIDMTAGIVAMRHADSNILTVAVDNLYFKDSAQLSDVVTLIGEITYVGNSSMEIRVDSFKENEGGQRYLINRAYLVAVAVDENNKPKQVPELILETEEQKKEWEAAEKRNELRKMRKKEGF